MVAQAHPTPGVPREKSSRIPAGVPINEPPSKNSVQSDPETSGFCYRTHPSTDLNADPGNHRRLLTTAVVKTSAAHRSARAIPVGMLLYLVSIAAVAIATTGIFFGMGFLLLLEPAEAVSTDLSTEGTGPDFKGSRTGTWNDGPPAPGKAASASIEPGIARSSAVVPRASSAGSPSPTGAASGNSATHEPSGEASLPPRTDTAPPAAPATTAAPAAASRRSSTVAVPASGRAPRLSAKQIAQLLARGDSFLRAGDPTSARLFYERAADAGNQQAAMRMGTTFDPSLLGRAGQHTPGDAVKTQSRKRRAVDLSGPAPSSSAPKPDAK